MSGVGRRRPAQTRFRHEPASMSAAGRAPVVPGRLPASPEHSHRGDGHDPETLPEAVHRVGVDLDHEQAPGLARGDFLDLRRHHPTRAAPRRPEVHDDRDRCRRYEAVEVRGAGDVDRQGRGGEVGLAAAAARRVAQLVVGEAILLPAGRAGCDDAAIVGGESRHTWAFFFLFVWEWDALPAFAFAGCNAGSAPAMRSASRPTLMA